MLAYTLLPMSITCQCISFNLRFTNEVLDMAFKLRNVLSEEQRKKLAQRDRYYSQRRSETALLSDKNLVATAKYCMSQMRGADHWEPGEPVYDATFYYVVLPELLKRLDEKADDDTRREIEKIRNAHSSHVT